MIIGLKALLQCRKITNDCKAKKEIVQQVLDKKLNKSIKAISQSRCFDLVNIIFLLNIPDIHVQVCRTRSPFHLTFPDIDRAFPS